MISCTLTKNPVVRFGWIIHHQSRKRISQIVIPIGIIRRRRRLLVSFEFCGMPGARLWPFGPKNTSLRLLKKLFEAIDDAVGIVVDQQ